ncbi:hypothetical protein GCM10011579_068180 [Streptomyces albiflavescens]|uniref:Uncharacterized protein n=1 Tax=Streptomyces albiflavescens TaxID=1623582 RepID=A0A917YAW8_9ACTN|nr:hypothetical protein GCM10011579_068180 [Streptomyces albiflavescens]
MEQTRRWLSKLRGEGLVERVTLPRRGRLRAWFPTEYGVWVLAPGRRRAPIGRAALMVEPIPLHRARSANGHESAECVVHQYDQIL